MVKVPSFLLKKLYVKGSLKNTEDGFSFQIKNVLADATINEPMKVFVDGKEIDPANITLTVDSETIAVADVSSAKPFPFKVKMQITISVKGEPLSPGPHKIKIITSTKEYGVVTFEVSDKI
ncbi:MAG: hypothetical protein DRO67_03260 [Candidatus Asgardarchaeum californiense]|nr:MAG: hypothetical protein DRO67_03260 [Candidatus Asgardarchaeum californiense]